MEEEEEEEEDYSGLIRLYKRVQERRMKNLAKYPKHIQEEILEKERKRILAENEYLDNLNKKVYTKEDYEKMRKDFMLKREQLEREAQEGKHK